MELSEALYSYLSGYAGLTALVENRIYPPSGASQKAKAPYVVYQKISDPQLHSSGSDNGPFLPRYQFSCYGRNYDEACDVAAQIRAALRDYTGLMGGEEGVMIQRSFLEDETDLYDENTERCGVAVDFIIWHD